MARMTSESGSKWAELALVDIAQIRGSQPKMSSLPKSNKAAGWNQARAALMRLGAVALQLTWMTPRGKAQISQHGDLGLDRSGLPHRRFSLGGPAQARRWSAGWIDVWFPEVPSSEQLAAVKAVINALADRMFAAHSATVATRAVSAVARVEDLVRNHKPGTVISRATNAVTLAMRGHHSGYVSLDGDIAYLEYHLRSSWNPTTPANYTTSPPRLVLGGGLTEAIAAGAIDFDDHDGALRAALSASGVREFADVRYSFQPIIAGGQAVGAFVVAVDVNTAVIPQIQKPALEAVASILSEPAAAIYERRFKKLIVDPIFETRDIKAQSDLAFVLMPFQESWSDRIWDRVLRPTLEGQGLVAMRADDMFGRDVMEDIWEGIVAAQVVIADISNRNANVFYELGIAHTLGKPVILLTQSAEDIPFDLNRFRHVIYEDNLDGYETLRTQVIASVARILREES